MNIYLIRHGEAEKSAIGLKDFDRHLTQQGRIRLIQTAENWKNYFDKFDFIVASPFLRAVQTAEIIKEVFYLPEEIIVDKKLAPGCKTESIIELATSLVGEEIAFIGHQPDLGEHASNLISLKGANIEFKKGAIAKISFENKIRLGKGTLEFLIPPSKK